MKTKSIIALSCLLVFLLASCSSPYKKRRRCRGNGSWYGKRNLSMTPEKEESKSLKLSDYQLVLVEDEIGE
ncbi:hypothetical protein PPO43_05590 [Saprospira sp. CCB-QB6]|uniref:hypothetical protein n=1 Tax=Saprospira sp. CCB-QB6 TaxID=3023936 RepID=UPI00234A265A|nr:hypothetical protein [Saprospira sp. CCB-QB6]WCL82570.1 hypothetical protein PPO43_05590 [Saprospira sp. CCB-QB6]